MAGTAVNNQVSSSTDASQNKVEAYDIGWMFVQQYFTFLNSSPDRLHCFYSPTCQFLRGNQGEQASTSVGQKDIRERIKAHGYSNCKVLISDIDVQSTRGELILVHVTGELENKGETQRFVQLFTLEESTSGFSIINDILRFIPNNSESKPFSTQTTSEPAPTKAPTTTEQPAPSDKTPKPAPSKASESAKPAATPAPAAEPKDKEAASTTTATPPSGPKTWANRVAAQADLKQTKAAPAASTPSPSAKSGVASPQSESKPAAAPQKDTPESSLSYIQVRVKDNISKKALHEVLSVHGPISHMEVKNGFAYVDFQNADSASKALAQGKFAIGSEALTAEPRLGGKGRFNGPSSNSQFNHGHNSENRRGGFNSQSRRGHASTDLSSPDRANFDQKGGNHGPRRTGSYNGPRNGGRNNRPSAQDGPKQA